MGWWSVRGWRREVARIGEGVYHEISQTVQSRAVRIHSLDLGEPDHAAWPRDTLHLVEHFGPVPRAHEAAGKAHIRQVEVAFGKFKDQQGVHDLELDPAMHLCCLGPRPRVFNHVTVPVYAHHSGHPRPTSLPPPHPPTP